MLLRSSSLVLTLFAAASALAACSASTDGPEDAPSVRDAATPSDAQAVVHDAGGDASTVDLGPCENPVAVRDARGACACPDDSVDVFEDGSRCLARVMRISSSGEVTCVVTAQNKVACWGLDDDGQVAAANDSPHSYLDVGASEGATCALRTTGEIDCWGRSGVNYRPYLSGSYMQLSVGTGSVCALTKSGRVVCGADVWSDEEPYQEVAAGFSHACARTAEGRIHCEGTVGIETAGPNASTEKFKTVSAGPDITCAIRDDGVLRCWGDTEVAKKAVSTANTFGEVEQVVVGSGTICAITAEHRVRCVGNMRDAALRGANAARGDYRALAGPGFHSVGSSICALTEAGRIECWGHDSAGAMLGVTGGQRRFSRVAVGRAHGCALDDQGHALCWDRWGELGAAPDTAFASLAAGAFSMCGLTNEGDLSCWGHERDVPQRATGITGSGYKQVDVTCGDYEACALDTQGALWGFRDMGEGEVTRVAITKGPWERFSAGGSICGLTVQGRVRCERAVPAPGPAADDGPFTDLAAGGTVLCALDERGVPRCWGRSEAVQGASDARKIGEVYAKLSASDQSVCALMREGRARCWGNDDRNQLSGLMSSSGVFDDIDTALTVTCGHRRDGTLACFGEIDMDTHRLVLEP